MVGGAATDYGPPTHTGSRRISLQNGFRFTQPTLVVTRIGNGRLVVVDSNFRNIATIHITDRPGKRSEEHTSELQSRPHLVCRLLLEKKKKSTKKKKQCVSHKAG